MGKPIKIVDLAKQMISLYGKEDEVEIVFTGLRPGEKLYEELLIDESEQEDTNTVPYLLQSQHLMILYSLMKILIILYMVMISLLNSKRSCLNLHICQIKYKIY